MQSDTINTTEGLQLWKFKYVQQPNKLKDFAVQFKDIWKTQTSHAILDTPARHVALKKEGNHVAFY